MTRNKDLISFVHVHRIDSRVTKARPGTTQRQREAHELTMKQLYFLHFYCIGSLIIVKHYNLFPRSIGQILHSFEVEELHLTFTQGRWQYSDWGYPLAPSAGTGVELWAWLNDDKRQYVNYDRERLLLLIVNRRLIRTSKILNIRPIQSCRTDEHWKGLTNTLSGLFCASLNFIDDTITTEPKLSFRNEGLYNTHSVPPTSHNNNNSTIPRRLRYGSLPHENVCTENLTPWIKLLPCKSKAGIASLLKSHKLFDTRFYSMAVHVRSVCEVWQLYSLITWPHPYRWALCTMSTQLTIGFYIYFLII